MNVLINGPEQLTDEDAQKIAEKWLKIRNRRTVTEQALKALESANSENDDEMNAVVALGHYMRNSAKSKGTSATESTDSAVAKGRRVEIRTEGRAWGT